MLFLVGCSAANHDARTIVEFQSPSDAVIAAIENELEMRVTLRIETMRKNSQWAFLSGIPLSTTRERIDYSNTRFANDIREGYFDDGFVALTKKNNQTGNWTLTILSLGATDAPFVDWPEQYGVPRELILPEH